MVKGFVTYNSMRPWECGQRASRVYNTVLRGRLDFNNRSVLDLRRISLETVSQEISEFKPIGAKDIRYLRHPPWDDHCGAWTHDHAFERLKAVCSVD